MSDLESRVESIIEWHKDRNLINGATDKAQAVKLLEEFIELYQAVNKFETLDDLLESFELDFSGLWMDGRIKVDESTKTREALKDAIGDMNVVMINIAERNKTSLGACLDSAYNDIKDRKGKLINGSFVKEADL